MNSIRLFLAFFAALPLRAAEMSIATPEDVGFSSERLGEITAYSRREVDQGRLVGVVTMVSRRGKIVHFDAVGNYGLDNDKPIDKDALFRIYSMTKPITTVAMMMLYEEGKFQLGDPVSKHLPEFAEQKILRDGELVAPASPMTIEQLMSHSAGLSYGFGNDNAADKAYQDADVWGSRDLAELVNRLSTAPLRFEPGSRYHYSIATDVLGAMVERLSGLTLDAFFRKRIFLPLGMQDTFFNVPEDKLHRLATNHDWNADEDRMAVVPAERGRPPTGVTLFSGGGGLISTAMDYMVFCEMLRSGKNIRFRKNASSVRPLRCASNLAAATTTA